MAITDKLDRITGDNIKALSVFVLSMDSEIRETARKAAEEGVEDPLVWLVDCRDSIGLRLAKEWEVEEVIDGRPVQEMPYAITRAVSYKKASERFARMPIDLEIPEPRSTHIDVLAVTEGGIFVSSLPRNPEHKDLWPGPGEIMAILSGLDESLKAPSHDLMLQAIVEPIDKTREGELIRAICASRGLLSPRKSSEIRASSTGSQGIPRKFEEFIAATYERDGWPEVILTQRSGDGGIDVIATKPGLGALRFLDQCKAYAPGRLVTHDDVRSMIGVLSTYPNASKGIITTTSNFQPGVFQSELLKPFMPHRVELRAGDDLRKWLGDVVTRQRP